MTTTTLRNISDGQQININDNNKTFHCDWKVLQDNDDSISTSVISLLIDNVHLKDIPEDKSIEVKKLFKYHSKLQISNGLLYYVESEDTKPRLVVPKLKQQEVIEVYKFGHFGHTRTYKLLKERFFWINMKNSIVSICENCERCQKAKTPKDQNRGPFQHIVTPPKPMHQISIDFLSIDTKAQSKFKVLTCVDEFIKYAFAFQVKYENAAKTAETLYKNIYTKYGIPKYIHSDRGASFLSKVIKELNNILCIKHTVTTPYRPQSNGSCERLNSIIINRIRTLHPREKNRWHLHLDSLILAYTSTVHESTGISPFYGMFGRQPKIPIDLMVRLPDVEVEVKQLNTFAAER